jgi:translocation protein SEC63
LLILLSSLTDEAIRRNWELYGHPDGRQEVSMGIALPQWIIEGKNNIWVLGMYGVIFGGVLPVLVGRWWFGSRQKTKDGVSALSAASFFKSLSEDSGVEDVVATLGKSYAWEYNSPPKNVGPGLEELERNVSSKMGADWEAVLKLTGAGKTSVDNEAYVRRKRALVLLYAHFLRLEVGASSLQKGAFREHSIHIVNA